MNLYSNRFLFTEYLPTLSGKHVFYANEFKDLKEVVNDGSFSPLVLNPEEAKRFRFLYYDPNYECKVAFCKGKIIQSRFAGKTEQDWKDDLEPGCYVDCEYRIKVPYTSAERVDFGDLRNLAYEITDLNESAITVLEAVNITESNKVITLLKCATEKMNMLLDKLDV